MVTFQSEPNQLVRFNPPIGLTKYVRFDENGQYTTEDERIIRRFHYTFDSAPTDATEPTPELSDDDLQLETKESAKQYRCNQCEYVSDNKGVLLSHKKSEHPKED